MLKPLNTIHTLKKINLIYLSYHAEIIAKRLLINSQKYKMHIHKYFYSQSDRRSHVFQPLQFLNSIPMWRQSQYDAGYVRNLQNSMLFSPLIKILLTFNYTLISLHRIKYELNINDFPLFFYLFSLLSSCESATHQTIENSGDTGNFFFFFTHPD